MHTLKATSQPEFLLQRVAALLDTGHASAAQALLGAARRLTPSSPRLAELSARLRAVLRRGAARENTLRVGDLEIDTVRRVVRRAGRALDLKPKEYALLEYLVRNSDRPLTKSLIIEHVWNIHFDSVSNVVEVHINALRNKVDRGFGQPLIHTIRGVGYILTDTPPAK